jgi:hypothetical protein
LNQNDSGFVPVATEEWPVYPGSDQVFTLFVRKGTQVTNLLKKYDRPVFLNER